MWSQLTSPIKIIFDGQDNKKGKKLQLESVIYTTNAIETDSSVLRIQLSYSLVNFEY